MNELSPQARAILERAARLPANDAGIQARVRAGIEAKLAAPTIATAGATKLIAGAIAVALTGASLLFWRSETNLAPTIAPPVPAEPSPVVIEPKPEIAPAVEASPVPLPIPIKPQKRVSVSEVPLEAPAPIDALEAERALVVEARAKIEARDFQAAQAILADADRRFADGVFATERRLLGAKTACALGDRPTADRLIEALPEGSPYRATAVSGCETGSDGSGHSVDR